MWTKGLPGTPAKAGEEAAQAPTHDLLQVDASAIGGGVNLFHGQLQFPVHLCTVHAAGGLSHELALLYRGETVDVDTWAPEVPESVVGNGWSLPIDRVELEEPLQAGSSVPGYVLFRAGQRYQLVPVRRHWGRGLVVLGSGTKLSPGVVPPAVVAAFARNGWTVSAQSRIEATTGTDGWWLVDNSNQRRFALTPTETDGTLQAWSGGDD